LILGKATLIEKLKKHPLIRALRVDKITLAALQATLLAYLEGKATTEIPVWRMISADLPSLARRAQKWRRAIHRMPLTNIVVQVVDTASTVGGGSLPGQTLPTKALALALPAVDALAAQLRQANPPIIARIDNQRLLLDPRTVLPEQDKALISSLKQALISSGHAALSN
jgi:L-seryl-tRNA(Ser) seleniumtransferase